MGSAYDDMLRSVFANGEMANLLQSDGLAGLFGTALFKTAPLRDLIARHVDAALLEAIAREYRTGRRLYVVTTNLDAQRTAIWDMGKIAASGDPRALELFRNVLTASASVPGVFPPVLIDVEAGGKRFAEMHVDGGVTTNVLIVPEAALLSGAALFAPNARPKVYIVMNGKLCAGLRRRDALDGPDRDTVVRNIGSCQHAQFAAGFLPICQTPELGFQPGLDRSRLSEVHVDRLRSWLSCSDCSSTATEGEQAESSGNRRRRTSPSRRRASPAGDRQGPYVARISLRCRPRRPATISAMIDTAISSGVIAPRSRPAGALSIARRSGRDAALPEGDLERIGLLAAANEAT